MTTLIIRDHRVHHGLVGLGAIAFGVVLVVHDRKDWRAWVVDLLRP